MTPEQFISKWEAIKLRAQSAAESHFVDFSRMLDESGPADASLTSDWRGSWSGRIASFVVAGFWAGTHDARKALSGTQISGRPSQQSLTR